MAQSQLYRKRGRYMLLIMAVVAVSVGVTSLAVLYQAAFEQEQDRLAEIAESSARLVDSMARFDQRHGHSDVPGGAFEATMRQVRSAHREFEGFGETGEFTLARRDGDRIVFLLSHRHYDLDQPRPVPLDSQLAQPMRAALEGRSGTMIGVDYRGVRVLSAFEPVPALGVGIVAKIDLDEVRRPFIRAGAVAAAIGLTVMLLGSLLFRRIGNPLIDKLIENERKYRALFAQGADAVLVSDATTGRVLDVNDRACAHLGYARDELVRLSLSEVFLGDDSAVLDATGGQVIEGRCRRKDGEMRDVQISGKRILIDGGEVIQRVCHDITQSRRAEEALRVRDRAIEAFDSGVIITDYAETDNPVIYCNPATERITGYSEAELLGRNARLLHADDSEQSGLVRLREAIAAGEHCQVELRNYRKDGTPFWNELTVSPVRDPHGRVTHFIGIQDDISERKRAEAQLKERERFLEDLTSELAEGLMALDTSGRIIFMNPEAERLLGWSQEDLNGNDVHSLIHDHEGQGVPRDACKALQALSTGKTARVERDTFFTRDGCAIPVAYTAAPIVRDGEVTGVVIAFRDIGERLRMEQELEHLATHDAVTGLLNRCELERRLNGEVARALRYRRAMALLIIDIDHFKRINDKYGHQAGDEVLRAFSRTVGSAMRSSDVLGRYGGEEFLVILPETPLAMAAQIAERLRTVVAALRIDWQGEHLGVTISVGVCALPEHGEAPAALVSAADRAMYEAKDKGRNRVCLASADD